MENRTLTLRPRTKLGWGPFGPTGNRNRSSPRHFHRRGWGYLAATDTSCPSPRRSVCHNGFVKSELGLSSACSEKLSEELFGVVGIVS